MGDSNRRSVRTFSPAPESVSAARRFARATLSEWGADDVADDALLVVSELVTNAVMHAGTEATLELRTAPGGVRLGVEDLHPTRMLRMGVDPSTGADERGRGLLITASLAAAWGVEYLPTSKRVWALFASEVADAPPGGDLRTDPPAGLVAPATGNGATNGAAHLDPLGLRGEALSRLDLEDLLRLVVEQARERLAADAAYLLLAHGLDEHYTVRATSGLPPDLVGRAVTRGEVGAPGRRSSFLPVLVEDLDRTPAPLVAGSSLRSLVVAPVAYEGRVVGALVVLSERVRGFTDGDAAQLQRAADWVGSAVERARLRAAERERRGWLSFLSDAGVLLSSSLDPATTITMIGQIVVPRLATWCAIQTVDDRGVRRLENVWHADERRLDALRDALERIAPAMEPEPGDPVLTGHVATLPLEARGRVVARLVLGREEKDGPLRGELRTVAEAFATRAALAIDNARAHTELASIGRTLQRSLLPPTMPRLPGVDLGVSFEPAGVHNTVGGDFYDVFPAGAGRWCFVVGDVCGGGPEAAAVTGLARHTIRAMLRSGFAIGPTLERLNDAINEEGERGRFLTLVCGTLEAGARSWYQVRLVCAGHPPPFLVRDGVVSRVGRPQALLGVLDRVDYAEEELRLPRGSRLVTVTDGVLERRSGDRMFDDEGVETELAASVPLSAQGAADRIRRAATDFAGVPSEDDIAVLVLDLGSGGNG